MDGNAKIWPKEREKKKEENSRYSCPKNDEVRKGTQHTHTYSKYVTEYQYIYWWVTNIIKITSSIPTKAVKAMVI